MNAPSREGDLRGLVSWAETLPAAPTGPFEQCPIQGTESLLGPLQQQEPRVQLIGKQTEKAKQGCVEILTKFYSLVFKLATPSKSGGFLVQCSERIHCRYKGYGIMAQEQGRDQGM